MCDGDLNVVLVARGDHLVGLAERLAKRFFLIDAAHTGLRGGDHHVPVLVKPAGADADEVQFLLLEHLPVVCVALGITQSFNRLGQAVPVVVHHCDDFCLWEFAPDGVQPVPVITAAGAADDAHSIIVCHDEKGLRDLVCHPSAIDACAGRALGVDVMLVAVQRHGLERLALVVSRVVLDRVLLATCTVDDKHTLGLGQPGRDGRFVVGGKVNQRIVKSVFFEFPQDRFAAVLVKKSGVVNRPGLQSGRDCSTEDQRQGTCNSLAITND